MRYLCLGFRDPKVWEVLSMGDRDAMMAAGAAYDEHLRRNGHYVDGVTLGEDRGTATLRFDDGGKVRVTDGPFTQTKEQLGGFVVLEANDLNHAIALMSQTPCMRLGGSIEIRPIEQGTNY